MSLVLESSRGEELQGQGESNEPAKMQIVSKYSCSEAF